MWRTLIIIVVLCGAFAWFFTNQAPQRSGTLKLTPAATFPADKKADLGRAVAHFLPHCPGFGQVGAEALFTDLATDGSVTRITFSVPAGAKIPSSWGPANAPCVYALDGNTLRISGQLCQAMCLGKVPDAPQDMISIDLNPKPQSSVK